MTVKLLGAKKINNNNNDNLRCRHAYLSFARILRITVNINSQWSLILKEQKGPFVVCKYKCRLLSHSSMSWNKIRLMQKIHRKIALKACDCILVVFLLCYCLNNYCQLNYCVVVLLFHILCAQIQLNASKLISLLNMIFLNINPNLIKTFSGQRNWSSMLNLQHTK